MIIWNRIYKIKNHMMINRYHYMISGYIFMSFFFIGAGIACENLYQWSSGSLYNFGDKGTGILVILGLIWLVTVGLLLHVAQWGDGKKVGLSIFDIAKLELNRTEIFGSVFIIVIKLFVYVWIYIDEKKWLLFFEVLEGILSLCLICVFIICITNKHETSRLIRKQMKRSFRKKITKKNEEKFCQSLLQMAKMMNYQDNEECDELIECIAQYIESIGDVGQYMNCKDYESQHKDELLVQIMTLGKVISNLYTATKGEKLLEHIMQQCVEKLCEKNVNYFNIYLLIKELLVRNAYALEAKAIVRILTVMPQKSDDVRDCIICYLSYLEDKTTEKVWAKKMREEFIPEDNYRQKNFNRVFYIENMIYEYRTQKKRKE